MSVKEAPQDRVKSTGQYRGDANTALANLVEKSETDMVTYYDPMGWTSRDGEPINEREKMYEEGNWDEKFEQVNRLAQKGEEVELRDAVKNALDSGRVSMPVYVSEDIFISDAQDLPVAEGLARVAVDTNEIRLDEVASIGEISSAFEESTDVELANDDIEKYEYSIYGVGIRKKVSDLLVHTGRYSPQQLKTETANEAIQRYKEAQAIQGTAHDAEGFEGLLDWVDADRETDYTEDVQPLTLGIVRDLITELEVKGTARENIMVVSDHRSFRNLKDELDDVQRFESPGDSISFGLTALEVDGVMVSQTHGTPSAEGDRQAVAFDASGTFWAQLADTTVKALPPTPDSVEQMLVYEYCTLASNARERIASAVNLD